MNSQWHGHANSKFMEEHHRDVYERLYRACPTVVSAPAILRWSPTYAIGPGGIGLNSKLPLRMHVGIEPQSEGGLRWGEFNYFIPERDAFAALEETQATTLIFEILASTARQFGKSAHARVWVCSEIPFFRGLNADPLCAATFATAWLLHLGVITPSDVERFVSEPTAALLNDKEFLHVWRLALRIESVIATWVADGDLIIASLIDAKYPVIFFRERDPILFDRCRDLGVDDPSSYYNIPANLFFRVARMEELLPLDAFPHWPIDIALAHLGEEGSSISVYKTRGAFASRLNEAAVFARTHLLPLTPEAFREQPKFGEFTQETPQQSAGISMFRVYRDNNVVHSMIVLKTMYDLFQYGATSHILREFIHSQNICQDLLRLAGLSPLAISRPRTTIRLTGNRLTETGVACRLIGPGIHGCLMVAGPLHSLEGVLAEALPRISDEIQKPVHCHYASWCDGAPPTEGLRVHQHLASGRSSAYIKGATVTVRIYEHNQPTSVLMYSHERWEQEREKYDVALDHRENKIYVHGKPLDSNDIHTTKQTLELMRCILTSGKREFSADELPASSYRNDRNQLESKVVRPFKAAVERYTGRQFELRVTGGLRRDYSLIFTPNGHRIAWVERL